MSSTSNITILRTIILTFIYVCTTFRPICLPAIFRYLFSNSGTFLSQSGFVTELRTQPFIRSTGVLCSRSPNHSWVQVLSCVNYYSMLLSPLTRIEPEIQNNCHVELFKPNSYIHCASFFFSFVSTFSNFLMFGNYRLS